MKATRSTWKTRPMPGPATLVPLHRTFTKKQFEKIVQGVVPHTMDDRWFIFHERGWLNFHRSWSGLCYFRLRLRPTESGYEVAEAWSALKGLRRARTLDYNADLISSLISDLLLRRKSS